MAQSTQLSQTSYVEQSQFVNDQSSGLVALGNDDNCITDYSYIYRVVGMCKKCVVEVRLGHDDIEMEEGLRSF
jgi:hypothetical protein